jgi:hypothetical protein
MQIVRILRICSVQGMVSSSPVSREATKTFDRNKVVVQKLVAAVAPAEKYRLAA